MMKLFALTVTAVASTVLAIQTVVAAPPPPGPMKVTYAAVPACTEDMACWDWATMGDRRRGFVIDSHTGLLKVVGGPCRYAKVRRMDMLHHSTKPMRGDRTAMRITRNRPACRPYRVP